MSMEKQLSDAQQEWQQILKPTKEEFYTLHHRILKTLPTETKRSNISRALLPALLTLVIILVAVLFVPPLTYKNDGTPSEKITHSDGMIFKPGSGGDLNWWLQTGNTVQDADEKTICGFVISVLQGKIGAYQYGSAEIDQYITPLHQDIKKLLRGYDAPNGPKIKQIHFSNAVKDQTGVTYTLEYKGNSTIQGETFEGNMAIHLNSTDRIIDDLKVVDTKPPLGIIYDAEGYLDSKIANGWRGFVDGRYLEIYAGAIAKKPEQGLVILVDHTPDGIVNYAYNTPTQHGMIKVLKEENLNLTLQAADGTQYIFDVKKRSFNDTSSLTEQLAIAMAKNKFTINIPKSWEAKYEVVDRIDDSSVELISFINIANKEYGGVLFTISVWPTKQWISDGQEIAKHIQISKIGEKGDKTFTLNIPSDVEFNINDKELKAAYQTMANDINTIKTSFKITN